MIDQATRWDRIEKRYYELRQTQKSAPAIREVVEQVDKEIAQVNRAMALEGARFDLAKLVRIRDYLRNAISEEEFNRDNDYRMLENLHFYLNEFIERNGFNAAS